MLTLDIPIKKVDAARRLVTGVATAEIPDRVGEVCDYATTKPLYEQWSQSIAATTGGKSLGNLRAMHGNVAAGKLVSLKFNDDLKQIEICAKVVDDAEWAKVEEGVYTGFSQGGTYVDRWKDPSGIMRYTAEPHEISLVDLPCLPEARFELIKSDGSQEMRLFKAAKAPIDVEKAGARNSAADLARIQAMHDTAVDLGAECRAHKRAPRGDAELTKQFDTLARAVSAGFADLSKRLAAIESQPQVVTLPGTRSVAKHEDAASLHDALLDDPAALSLLAIKLAQRQRR